MSSKRKIRAKREKTPKVNRGNNPAGRSPATLVQLQQVESNMISFARSVQSQLSQAQRGIFQADSNWLVIMRMLSDFAQGLPEASRTGDWGLLPNFSVETMKFYTRLMLAIGAVCLFLRAVAIRDRDKDKVAAGGEAAATLSTSNGL